MSSYWSGTSTPILPVADMGRAIAFYERIGLDVELYRTGEYAFVRGDGITIDLSVTPEYDPLVMAGMTYLTVTDPDALHKHLAALEVPRLSPVENKPWGMREFALADPDNNLIRIGAALK
ncbi:N/A [soil metagenome]